MRPASAVPPDNPCSCPDGGPGRVRGSDWTRRRARGRAPACGLSAASYFLMGEGGERAAGAARGASTGASFLCVNAVRDQSLGGTIAGVEAGRARGCVSERQRARGERVRKNKKKDTEQKLTPPGGRALPPRSRFFLSNENLPPRRLRGGRPRRLPAPGGHGHPVARPGGPGAERAGGKKERGREERKRESAAAPLLAPTPANALTRPALFSHPGPRPPSRARPAAPLRPRRLGRRGQ